jgi:Domain of unknown function (DUF4279)
VESGSIDKPLRLSPTEPVGELIWVAGGSVDECSVSLRFFGDDLDPDSITKSLGIRPTTSYRKGDVFRGKADDRIHNTGSWRYGIQRRADIDLEELINKLFNRITPNLEIWHNLTTKFQSDLFCGLWLKRANGATDLSPAVMMKIAERGLSIGLDIYFDDEDKIDL